MKFPLRCHGLLLMAGLILASAQVQAQAPALGSTLGQMRSQVDSGLELLRPILGGEPLHTWDGRSGLAPSQVNAILVEVAAILEDLHAPLQTFTDLANAQLGPDALVPVLDDLQITARDLDQAIAQLPLAAHEHGVQAAHAVGCKHNNPPMLRAVELVRDISANLALIEGTLELFAIPTTE